MNNPSFGAEKLPIVDAYIVKYHAASDQRGVNTFPFVVSQLAAVMERNFSIAQINVTHSMPRTFRGIHLTAVPPGQAKYVSAIAGACIDFLVDLRIGSPSFKTVCTIPLTASQPQGIYIPEGVGHGILCLEESASVLYCCNQEYTPHQEITINPYDPALELDIPANFLLSDKDRSAPVLSEVELPLYQNYLDICQD